VQVFIGVNEPGADSNPDWLALYNFGTFPTFFFISLRTLKTQEDDA
jgi:hypothetical protein